MSYNFDERYSAKAYTPASQSKAVFGQARVVKGITIHWWGNPNTNPSFAGVRDYLCRPASTTSAHFVASGTGRQVACIVSPDDVAWHSGNAQGNATTIGIECDPRCRDEDYDVVAELVADLRSVYGDVPIYSHNMWSATACPGNYNIDRIDQLSYTKYSPPGAFGQVRDKNPKQPTPPPAPAPEPPVVKPNPTPSPTADPPAQGGGSPVAEKPDYAEENNALLKAIKAVVDMILAILTKVFK